VSGKTGRRVRPTATLDKKKWHDVLKKALGERRKVWHSEGGGGAGFKKVTNNLGIGAKHHRGGRSPPLKKTKKEKEQPIKRFWAKGKL